MEESLEFQNVYFTFCVKSFDKGRLRKVANVFSIGKSTASRIIRRVAQAISKLLATKYVQVHTTEEDVNSLVKTSMHSTASLNVLEQKTVRP